MAGSTRSIHFNPTQKRLTLNYHYRLRLKVMTQSRGLHD
ncbi:hypothetical protein 101220B2_025 [Escherichia phage vB_EcoP-101120B2]|uniref:Uncharacterized protein n=2 Tax=Kayfunavirus TaxID=2732686 RepID=A0AAE8C604_9CAUD|nr:hypothetical protein 22664BS1_023 [Escherichia phage vB_EcoP-22664BS1]QZI78599.1 hypothetical protein 22664UKE3-2_024 [Escherichia phage vB_EcoP-22664UKE3-2]QZI79709.1 hypothetical protein 101118UKE1_024 [Escherichia phage vB_EcoP-101118UKE1]QZI79772.1 hypothetical protein 101120B1-2_025 [Escherichia phage vB_EcoP-101120B1-2]QZI79832.1 hypothetical protein 101220B2_025 [Escherichia phage vB_EcoP-101120B2]QZI84316.1 hypothetical protein PM129_026 [Escherichia phage vB_EcoP-PM129]QZI84377.1 